MKKIMFNDRFGLTDAVLNGSKTQTRRLITPQPTYNENTGVNWKGRAFGRGLNDSNEPQASYNNFSNAIHLCKDFKGYKVGEVVAVAQSYKDCGEFDVYEAPKGTAGWNNKMFVKADLMPHQIRITGIRIERLQDISEEDCLKEGIYKGGCGSKETHFMDAYYYDKQPHCLARGAYSELIDEVSGKGTWDRNPFVWVYDFELIK